MMRGVSAAKEDVHNAIKNIDKGIFPQAFCKIIPDILGGDPEYCNIMHADGAGTKSSLAYMYWKETGDLSVWKGIAQDAIVMNTDDLLCVGAVDNILVSSTIGRNKMLVPGEVISAIINGTDELLAEMRDMGIGIYPTGGETADVGDLVRTIIVDSTVTCRMKRSDVIDNANIRPGDVIVGISSTGQATYEKKYNGGMGSNGLTSARHDVFAKYLAEKYPERKIYLVDSLGASSGYGLIMETLADMRDLGKSIDELYQWIEENKLRMHHWFFSTDLSFYIKGGRISKTAGMVGTMLNICPLLNMDNVGKLKPREKIRGKKKVVQRIVEMMVIHAEEGVAYDGKCYICHSVCTEDAKVVAALAEAKFPNLQGKVEIYPIGATIGSHTGPGTLALFFWGDKRMD